MNHEDALKQFFDAENRRDWTAYIAFLHPDVEWVLFGRSETLMIQGIEEAYTGNNDSFSCETLYSGVSGSRITAVLRNNHGQRSTEIFEFENGLIRKEWEFLLG